MKWFTGIFRNIFSCFRRQEDRRQSEAFELQEAAVSNMPENKKIPLATLPQNVLMDVMMKTTNRTLCRLRRTCGHLNQIAEGCKGKLASRNVDGFFITIYLEEDDLTNREKECIYRLQLDPKLKNKLSAVCINTIILKMNKDIFKRRCGFFLEQIGELNIRCLSFYTNLPIEFLVQILDIIQYTNVVLLYSVDHLDEDLAILNQTTHKSNVCVVFETRLERFDLYELIKDCRFATIPISPEYFREYLWDLYRDQAVDVRDRLGVEFVGTQEEFDGWTASDTPPIVTLLDSSSIVGYSKTGAKVVRIIEKKETVIFITESVELPEITITVRQELKEDAEYWFDYFIDSFIDI